MTQDSLVHPVNSPIRIKSFFHQVVQKHPKTAPVAILCILIVTLCGLNTTAWFYQLNAINRKNIRASTNNFTNYVKTVDSLVEHLKDENDARFDSDSFDREAKKGQILLTAYEREKQPLESYTKSLSCLQSSKCAQMRDYIKVAEEIALVEREAVKMYAGYNLPLRLNEELAVRLAGDRFYMYTSPDKYITSMDAAISQKVSILTALDSLAFEGKVAELHAIVIRKLTSELEYIIEMRMTVDTKSDDAVVSAEQKYKKTQQDLSKLFNQKNDELAESIRQKTSELDIIRGEVITLASL